MKKIVVELIVPEEVNLHNVCQIIHNGSENYLFSSPDSKTFSLTPELVVDSPFSELRMLLVMSKVEPK